MDGGQPRGDVLFPQGCPLLRPVLKYFHEIGEFFSTKGSEDNNVLTYFYHVIKVWITLSINE